VIIPSASLWDGSKENVQQGNILTQKSMPKWYHHQQMPILATKLWGGESPLRIIHLLEVV